MNIGIKIKELRIKRGITLKELSEKSALSVGFLSQLERGLTTISVDLLERVSEILEVSITYFFDIPSRTNDKILRSYEQLPFDIEEGGFIQYYLSGNLQDKTFIPRLIEILPQNREEKILPYSHEGEEFVYVLEGILTLYIDEMRYELYPGDTSHISSKSTHNWANYTNKKVKLVAINSPNKLCIGDKTNE